MNDKRTENQEIERAVQMTNMGRAIILDDPRTSQKMKEQFCTALASEAVRLAFSSDQKSLEGVVACLEAPGPDGRSPIMTIKDRVFLEQMKAFIRFRHCIVTEIGEMVKDGSAGLRPSDLLRITVTREQQERMLKVEQGLRELINCSERESEKEEVGKLHTLLFDLLSEWGFFKEEVPNGF